MSTNTATTDEYTRALSAMIDGRMSAGQELAAAAASVREARATLDAASEIYADAWAAALAAGWSETELRRVFKDVGVETPAKPRRSRQTARRERAAATASTTPRAAAASTTEPDQGSVNPWLAPGEHDEQPAVEPENPTA